jgi:hypothetical protein
MNASGRSSAAASSGRLSLPGLSELVAQEEDGAPKPHFDFDNDDIDVALRVVDVDSNHNSSVFDAPQVDDADDDSSTSSEVFLNLDDSHKTSLTRAAAADGSRASGKQKDKAPENAMDAVVQVLSRPRANTRVLVVDEATANNVILAHVDSDEESDHAENAPPEHQHPTSEFHKLPLNKSDKVTNNNDNNKADDHQHHKADHKHHQHQQHHQGDAKSAAPAAKSPRAAEPVIQFATDSCYRCKKLPYVLKMSIRVQDPVDHYKLVSFCTLCAIAVQGDRVEATRVAGGDVERAIRDKAAQNALRKPCERCKKRPAHCVTDFDKKKRQLCCGVCFAEHKDFKKLSQFALSCVVNLDFRAARQAFLELLTMAPNNAQVLYNLACVESLTRHQEAGLKLLKMAFENGYNNWKQVQSDVDLERLRAMPEFAALLAEFKPKKLLSPR